MSLFKRFLQLSATTSDQGASPVEQPHRFFDATNCVGQALGRAGQCVVCGQPLADHFDRANRFHSCAERPVRRAA